MTMYRSIEMQLKPLIEANDFEGIRQLVDGYGRILAGTAQEKVDDIRRITVDNIESMEGCVRLLNCLEIALTMYMRYARHGLRIQMVFDLGTIMPRSVIERAAAEQCVNALTEQLALEIAKSEQA